MSEAQVDPQASSQEDEIKARREARRRKILENAKSRLEKLNGRVQQNGDIKKTDEIFPDPEEEKLEDFPLLQNRISSSQPRTFSSPLAQSFGGGYQENIFELLNNFPQGQLGGASLRRFDDTPTTQHGPPRLPSRLSRILRTKVHLVLIALVTYILFATGNEFVVSYSVFFPLLLWELVEFFLLKQYRSQEASLFSIVLLISGISPAQSTALIKTLGTLNKIFKDVGVFVFFFVLYHILSTWLLSDGAPQLDVEQPLHTHSFEM